MLPSIRKDPQQEWIDTFVAASKNQSGTSAPLRALWWNPINHNSLRLTYQGFVWVKKSSKQPYWKIEIEDIITGKQLLQLERLFRSPYLLTGTSLVVFSEEDCVMLQLHAGNLGQYLNNLQI